jgi:hypothetical protein
MCSGFSVVFWSNGGINFCAPDEEGNMHHGPVLNKLPEQPSFNGEKPYVKLSCPDWSTTSYQVEDGRPNWFTPEVEKEAKTRVLNLMKKVKAAMGGKVDLTAYQLLLDEWNKELPEADASRTNVLNTLIQAVEKEYRFKKGGSLQAIMGYVG